MAYDGFYSGLSSRGSVNEILNEALQVQQEVEAAHQDVIIIRDQVEASKASIDESVIHVDAVKDSVDTSAAAVDAALIEVQATDLRTKGYADEAEASKDAAKVSEDNAKDSEEVVLTALADVISVKRYGAIGDGVYRPVSDWYTIGASAYRGYANLAAVQVDYPHVTSATQSVDWAGIQAAINTGKQAYAPTGKYLCTDPLIGVRGGGLHGDGCDRWDTVFVQSNEVSFRKEDSRGTHIYAYGDFAKTFVQEGMSDCSTSGGHRTVNGKLYQLLNFRNNDSTAGNPSTKKLYSAAIRLATEFRLSNLRVIPWFNGINGYLDKVTLGLGSDIDVGIDTTTAWRYQVDNVQVVGYWRMCGALVSVSRETVGGVTAHGNGERGFWSRCILQGLKGAAIRGYDRIKVISHTADTITIPADPSFYATDGNRLSYAGTVSAGFNWTGFTYNSGDNTVTLNNVVPPIVGTIFELRQSPGPNGLSYTDFIDCYFTGWEHTSLKRSEELGYIRGGPIEISGFGIRQPIFTNCKFQTHEGMVAHLHDCINVRMYGVQFEGKSGVSELIASPFDSNGLQFTALQRGITDDLWMGCGSIINDSIGTSGFTPRGCYYDRGIFTTQSIGDTDDPLFFQNWRKGPLKIRDDSGKVMITIPPSDSVLRDPILDGDSWGITSSGTDVNVRFSGVRNLRLNNDSGQPSMKFFQSGRAEILGSFVPSTGAFSQLGQDTSRFSDTYTQRITLGSTGQVRILTGSGSPESAFAAVVGSIYLRSGGGASTTLYVKESGTGNTGWVAK